jgi:DNA-binding CsgD family transcriptional regulator
VLKGSAKLSPRQLEVLRLLSLGHGDKEIAHRLGVSERAVRGHVAQCRGRLGAANRVQLVALALRLNIIDAQGALPVATLPPRQSGLRRRADMRVAFARGVSRVARHRLVFGATVVMAIAVGLALAAESASPGTPLFVAQKVLDDAVLAAPRSATDQARAEQALAEKRVRQAASASRDGAREFVAALLDDAMFHFHTAGTTLQHLPSAPRAAALQELANAYRRSAWVLGGVSAVASPASHQLVLRQHEVLLAEAVEHEQEAEEVTNAGGR